MKARKPGGRKRGSNLLEFAFIMPLLLTLSLMLVQYGIIMYATISLANLSRDGARYGAIDPVDADIKSRIQTAMPPNLKYTDLTINITPTAAASRVTNSPITVSLSYNMSKKLFLPASMHIGGIKFSIFSTTFTTQTSMRIE